MDVKARLVPVPVLVDTPPMVHEYLAAELRDGGSFGPKMWWRGFVYIKYV